MFFVKRNQTFLESFVLLVCFSTSPLDTVAQSKCLCSDRLVPICQFAVIEQC